MDLSALAAALLATWLTVSAPATTQAYLPAGDVPTIEQPRSGRFRIEGSLVAGPEQGSVRGQGAFAQPDRGQITLEGTVQGRTERAEVVIIGSTVYSRTSRDGRWEVHNIPGDSPFSFPPSRGGRTAADEHVGEVLSGLTPLGVEALEGIATERYHGELDFLTLARGLTARDPTISNPFEHFLMTLDLWVGQADRYLRQLKLAVNVRMRHPGPGQPNSVAGELTFAAYDLDRPITISSPLGQQPPVQAPAQLPARR